MPDLFTERVFGGPRLVLAGLALVVAVAYAFVPVGGDVIGLRRFVLRRFHTLAWVFLAVAALARSKALGLAVEMAAPLAGTGGLLHVVLMLTTLSGGSGNVSG